MKAAKKVPTMNQAHAAEAGAGEHGVLLAGGERDQIFVRAERQHQQALGLPVLVRLRPRADERLIDG